MTQRFKSYQAPTLEDLIRQLNEDQTMFSTVVYIGPLAPLSTYWAAVLDFAFNPVVTPDGIEDMQNIAEDREKALSDKYITVLSL